jgi:hypothetical protein
MAHLSLDDHQRLAQVLLAARAALAEVSSTLQAAWPKHLDGPLHQGLKTCLRELDGARERLAAVLTHEHRHWHPASGRRCYFPVVDGPPGDAA